MTVTGLDARHRRSVSDRLLRTVSVKRVVAYALLALGLVGALAALVLAGRVVVRSTSGADPATALHVVAELPPDADRLVTWEPDAWRRERRLEPGTRIALEAAYLRAWAALGAYQSTGEAIDLIETFSGPARAQALALPGQGSATWSLRHRLRLEFYALDGATVALTDTSAQLARALPDGSVLTSTDRYAVVMVLEDGYWRVRQLRREATATDALVTPAEAGVGVLADRSLTAHPLAVGPLRATRYAPPGWSGRAGSLTRDAVATDLARIRALGFTAIRLPVPFATIGGSSPTDAGLGDLGLVLDAAQAQGLRVLPTLLQGMAEAGPAGWSAGGAHVAAVLARHGGHPAVTAWIVVDRPDDGATRVPDPVAAAFALHLLRVARTAAPQAPLTVAWADPALAADPDLAAAVDIVTWHSSTRQTQRPAAALGRIGADGRAVLWIASVPAPGGPADWLPGAEPRRRDRVARTVRSAGEASVGRLSVEGDGPLQSDGSGLRGADGRAELGAAIAASTMPPTGGAATPLWLEGASWAAVLVALLILSAASRAAAGSLPGAADRHGLLPDRPTSPTRRGGAAGRSRSRGTVGRRAAR